LTGVVAMAAGFFHNLALKSDGTVLAWGTSTNAADIGTDPNYGQTIVPAGLSNVVSMGGGGWHSLALRSDGIVVGWGRNEDSQATPPVPAAAFKFRGPWTLGYGLLSRGSCTG
jgi:alpha-tubulin suppressor-like RCC1 family protein